MANTDPADAGPPARRRSVREVVQRALARSQWLRRILLTLSGVVAPGTLAYIQVWGDASPENAPIAIVATVIVVVAAVAIAVALAITEEDLRPLVHQIDSLGDNLVAVNAARDDLQKRLAQVQANLETLRQDTETKADYWRTIYVVKQEITAVTSWDAFMKTEYGEENVLGLIHELLEIIVSRRNILFQFGAKERWAMSVYVRDSDRLRCIAYRGDAMKDNGEGHREWELGNGHVGVASLQRWKIVIDDASKDEWFKLFRDRTASEAKLEVDAKVHRSLAVIPFHIDPGATDIPSNGVICATSSEPGRFTEANVAPLIDMTLGVIEVLRTLVDPEDIEAELAGDGAEPLEEDASEGHK